MIRQFIFLNFIHFFFRNINYVEGQAGELWERKCVDSETIPGIMGCNDTDAGGVKTHRCKCNTDLCNEKFANTTENTTPPTMSTSSSQLGKCLTIVHDNIQLSCKSEYIFENLTMQKS